jgi:hypothetical protein
MGKLKIECSSRVLIAASTRHPVVQVTRAPWLRTLDRGVEARNCLADMFAAIKFA